MKKLLKQIDDKLDELMHWKGQLAQAHRRGKGTLAKKTAWDALKRSSRAINSLMLRAEKNGEVSFDTKQRTPGKK